MNPRLLLTFLLISPLLANAEVVGKVAEAEYACPVGRIAVSIPWRKDPTLSQVRFIRDPGHITRCFLSEMKEHAPLETSVILEKRGDDLVVVGAQFSKAL